MAVGNFCFWAQRVSNTDWSQKPGNGCQPNPTDLEILEFIGRRGILFSGLKDLDSQIKEYYKDFRVLSDEDYNKWTRWPTDHPNYQEIPYAHGFIEPDKSWLDWRNAANDGAENDVPVEMGNNLNGFNADFYDNVHKKRYPSTTDTVSLVHEVGEERKT